MPKGVLRALRSCAVSTLYIGPISVRVKSKSTIRRFFFIESFRVKIDNRDWFLGFKANHFSKKNPKFPLPFGKNPFGIKVNATFGVMPDFGVGISYAKTLD